MPRIIETAVYSYAELSEDAKERARGHHRDVLVDCDWWTFVYEDAVQCARILGIEFKQKPVKLMNGETRYDPCIWFSGFSSQGDGACFDGSYRYAKESVKKIQAHAPQDAELNRIARALYDLQRVHGYRLYASMQHSGYYYHSGCMSVEVWRDGIDDGVAPTVDDTLTQLMRDFADWIYSTLQTEYEYQVSDECVIENIEANGYEFTEEGKPA